MLYVVLADLTVEEIPEAHAVVPDDGTLSAMDDDGHVLRRYERGEVLMFGLNESVKELAQKLREQTR